MRGNKPKNSMVICTEVLPFVSLFKPKHIVIRPFVQLLSYCRFRKLVYDYESHKCESQSSMLACIYNRTSLFYFILCLFYLSKQIALSGYFLYILSMTEIYFFWYHFHVLSFGNLIINSVRFQLTENIKRGNQGITE